MASCFNAILVILLILILLDLRIYVFINMIIVRTFVMMVSYRIKLKKSFLNQRRTLERIIDGNFLLCLFIFFTILKQ